MKKILLIAIFLLNINTIMAYENDYFKIDIPDTYKEEKLESGTYKWSNSKNNDNIIITVSKNNEDNKYNINNYTDENIEDYEKYLESEINKQLKEYKIEVDVKNVKKETLNNIKTISYDVIWPTKESTGYDIHQKGYAFTSENFIYVYTFNSDSEIENNEDFIKTINSFKLLDNKIDDDSFLKSKWKFTIVVGTICGVIAYFISALKKK